MKRRSPTKRKGAPTWSERMETMQLEAWANQLEGLWWNAEPEVRARFITEERPLSDCQMGDLERLAVAAFLRRLAGNPAVLKAIVAPRRSPGRKGNRKRAWLAALEFELSRREGKFDSVADSVAKSWGIGRATLTKAWGKFAERTAETQCLGGWRYWADYELRNFRRNHRSIKPRQRRAAFIKYLHSSN
ncbi:MAG: hypothetical protein WBE92_09655 [Steroidobacteraceae bacterium]